MGGKRGEGIVEPLTEIDRGTRILMTWVWAWAFALQIYDYEYSE